MVQLKAPDAERLCERPDPAWRVIVFFGPDEGLATERADRLTQVALGGSDDPLRLIRFEADQIGADPLRLLDEANTIGLFGGQRVIRIAGSTRRGQALAGAIEALLKTPPRDAIILLEAGDVARRHAIVAMCEKSPHAATLPCYLDGPREIAALIDRSMREAGVTIEPEARAMLAGLLGGDRRVTRLEIEKLALYAGPGGRIGVEDVATLIGDSADREAETAITAAFLGRMASLDAALAKLQGESADPGYILGVAIRQALDLVPFATLVATGAGSEELKRKIPANLPFPRKAEIEQMAQRWRPEQLDQAVAVLGEAQAQVRKEAALARPVMTRALWTLARLGGGSGVRKAR